MGRYGAVVMWGLLALAAAQPSTVFPWPKGLIVRPGAPAQLSSGRAAKLGCPTHVTKHVEIFCGVGILAFGNVDDYKLKHAATILAEYIDSNQDGQPDDPLALHYLLWNPQSPPEADQPPGLGTAWVSVFGPNATGWMPESCRNEMATQVLMNSEVSPCIFAATGKQGANGPTSESVGDGSLEEIAHFYQGNGLAMAHPAKFGLGFKNAVNSTKRSALGEALMTATKGAFKGSACTTNPAGNCAYPDGAIWTYDDASCEFDCQVMEYLFQLTATTLRMWDYSEELGYKKGQEDNYGQWKVNNSQQLPKLDPQGFALVSTDAHGQEGYCFHRRAPTGRYSPTTGKLPETCPLDLAVAKTMQEALCTSAQAQERMDELERVHQELQAGEQAKAKQAAATKKAEQASHPAAEKKKEHPANQTKAPPAKTAKKEKKAKAEVKSATGVFEKFSQWCTKTWASIQEMFTGWGSWMLGKPPPADLATLQVGGLVPTTAWAPAWYEASCVQGGSYQRYTDTGVRENITAKHKFKPAKPAVAWEGGEVKEDGRLSQDKPSMINDQGEGWGYYNDAESEQEDEQDGASDEQGDDAEDRREEGAEEDEAAPRKARLRRSSQMRLDVDTDERWRRHTVEDLGEAGDEDRDGGDDHDDADDHMDDDHKDNDNDDDDEDHASFITRAARATVDFLEFVG
mmetsp:Transcript_57775/g.131067  ORF Transcript_57775/g.131067 Transcript_57775/m.131067 type:complete len:685 (+) Transcript_57775:94-2148(+)